MNAAPPVPWISEVKYQDPATQTYLGSPTLVRLDGGEILAAHDYFGPGAPRNHQGQPNLSSTYRSWDNGLSWTFLAHIEGAYWSNLFVHRGLTYLLGTSTEYGNIVIRRSADGGTNWTQPVAENSGLLLNTELDDEPPNYHSCASPVLFHEGRLYRAFEIVGDPMVLSGFGAMVLSAAEDADLLRASSWRQSNDVPYARDAAPPELRDLKDCGWLEGNLVVDHVGNLCNILRVRSDPVVLNKAAMLRIEDEGRTLSTEAHSVFVDLPGGMSKFTIRRDPTSKQYWTLSNDMSIGPPRVHRNILSLFSSADLSSWTRHMVLMEDNLEKTPEDSVRNTGFQYVDWQFDGDDIIYLVRTAFDGAHNYHDANRITFGMIADFRALSQSGDLWHPEV